MYGNQFSGLYPQQFNQPQYQPYSNNQLIRVTGLDGAKAYQMNANSTVALFDNNEDIMYIKSTDGAGFPTIRTFRFEEALMQETKVSDFVSREEFEKFKKEVSNYGKQSIPKQSKSNSTENV